MNILSKLTRKLLIAVLTVATMAGFYQLDAMKREQDDINILQNLIFSKNESGERIDRLLSLLQLLETFDNDKIIMEIFPSLTFSITAVKNRPDVDGIILSTLKGFQFTNNQVSLVANVNNSIHYGTYGYNGKHYLPEELEAALRNSSVDRYPIHFHKKLNYLSGNEQLTILRYDNDGAMPIVVNVPENVKNAILKYLCNDANLQNKQCFDFFKEVFFDQSKNNNCPNNIPLTEQIEIIDDETSLMAGDGIVLFSKDHSGTIELKHFAIALENGDYISKFGDGGMLLITKLKSMMLFWGCTEFARASLVKK